MSHMTNESGDGTDQSESPPIDEGGCLNSGGVVLKKGPWTSAEDAILVDYVNKYGEGNWNSVQKHSGLSRCGKSCRLRWANHLRPNLKKGAFTLDEENKIIDLHSKMGNKWARMAASLPGRTDNEIKNYWNTRIKRRQRAGLPPYPPGVTSQTGYQENQNNQTIGDKRCYDMAQFDSPLTDIISDLDSKFLRPYVPIISDPSPNLLLMGGLSDMLPSHQLYGMAPPSKRLRASTRPFSGYGGDFGTRPILYGSCSNSIPSPSSSDFVTRPILYGSCSNSIPSPSSSDVFFTHDADPMSNSLLPFQNENCSASNAKLELPSIQDPDNISLADRGSPRHPSMLESLDNIIQNPPLSEPLDTDLHLSPRHSGLLEALVHESKTLSSGKNKSSDKALSSGNSSTVTPSDLPEWDNYGDPLSPLGYSAGTSSAHNFSGVDVKVESDEERIEVSDALLGYCSLQPREDQTADTLEGLAMLIANELSNCSLNENWEYGSCSWNI